MTMTSDFLLLVRNDLRNVKAYAGDITLGIEDNESSMEDVLHQLRNLKAYVESLYRGVDEHIRNPYLLVDEEEK